MADTDPAPETPPEEPLAPASQRPGLSPSPPSAPAGDNATATADAQALAAQMQKLEMERNLLRKKVDAAEKAERERQQKELEDKEEWRTIAEQNKAELEALRKEREEAETKSARDAATAEVFKDYSDNVIAVAKTTGLSANSGSDEDKAALKTKLDEIQKTVGSGAPKITGSNPAPASTPTVDGKKLTMQMHFDDRTVRENAIKTAVGTHPMVQNFREFAKQQNNVTANPS
jgi:hypothetical protein